MILFDLKCANAHTFEAWFRDGATFEKQSAAGEVMCPICGDSKVEKAPMAPRVSTARQRKPEAERAKRIGKALQELRAHIESTCEYVGDRFAEEARRIHYGEADPRGIYGRADDREAVELREEGIEFLRIPWPRRADG